MKFSLITAAALVALAGPAAAADLGGSYKDAPTYTPDAPQVSWTGFYIGGQFGYGNANHNLTLQEYHGAYCWDQNGDGENAIAPEDPYDPWSVLDGHVDQLNADGSCGGSDVLGTETGPYKNGTTAAHGDGYDPDLGAKNAIIGDHNNWDEDDHAKVGKGSRDLANLDGLNSHGFTGGVTLGADYQMQRFVVGVFGSYDFANMKTEGSITDFASFEIEKGDEWSLGARFGYLATPRTMVYALAAYTQTDYDFKASLANGGGSASKTIDFDGIKVGGGVEIAVARNVFLGLEYTHTFYGDETLLNIADDSVGGTATGHGVRLIDDLDEDKIMGTLKIKLNNGDFDRLY